MISYDLPLLLKDFEICRDLSSFTTESSFLNISLQGSSNYGDARHIYSFQQNGFSKIVIFFEYSFFREFHFVNFPQPLNTNVWQ